MASPKVPRRLYKFKAFSAQSLELLVEDLVFYANPAEFNDPLDSQPSLQVDLDVADLERVLTLLIKNRLQSQMNAAAAAIKYRGPKTQTHIQELSTLQAKRVLEEIAYKATDPEFNEPAPGPIKFLLGRHIQEELLRRYETGILSLGRRYACPLMWSHYGDQHRGLCLGYSVPAGAEDVLHQVHYGGSREVLASQVLEMLNGSELAKRAVDEAVFLRKASDWRYEREWRHLGVRGLHDSPFELEEVIFGLRCNASVKHAVRTALERRDSEVRLYQMRQSHGDFRLRKAGLDVDDLTSSPRRSLTGLEAFFDELDGAAA